MTEESVEVRLAKISKDIIILKTEVNLQLAALDKALVIQSHEYARRLNELNGEAERLKQMQVNYLPREKFEDYQKRLDTEISSINNIKGQLKGSTAAISIFVSAMTALLLMILQWIISKKG